MSQFVDNIFRFFYSIYDSVFTWFYENNQYSLANNFFTKQVFDGELLSIGMTWEELLRIILPFIVFFFFIILIFKLFINMIGLFTK